MEQGEAKQGEKQSDNPGSLLICSDRDIFADDSLTSSQLLASVKAPTPVDPIVPARSAETEKAMQPAPDFDWNQEVEDQDSAYLSIAWKNRNRDK